VAPRWAPPPAHHRRAGSDLPHQRQRGRKNLLTTHLPRRRCAC
jgi:hypothetical protein